MPDPVLRLELGWQAAELRIFRRERERLAELYFEREGEKKLLVLYGPSKLEALTEILTGIDFLEIFDRDYEDGFHRDFGRYRVVYFKDDPHEFHADRFEVF